MDGIIAYQREHELWSIYVGEQERGARPPAWLRNWKGDGIIARIETEAIASVVRRTHLPTVDVSAARKVRSIPWVETDDRELARLAARHLIDRGFRTLAFCGEPLFNWSKWREQHFVAVRRGGRLRVPRLSTANRPARRTIPGPASGGGSKPGSRSCPSRSA